MLSPELLAALGRGRDRSGSRGIVARAAWRRLVRAGDRGESSAWAAVWFTWWAAPDREFPGELARWPVPPYMADTLARAAVEPRHSARNRRIIGSLVPSSEVTGKGPAWQAKFYVLTGQEAQYRVVDPGGSLLAAAYETADEASRAALRDAMTGIGALDLVRVVSGTGGQERLATMTAPEREYLVSALARHEDWERTWRLATELPLAGAAAVARQLAGRWSPADAGARQLLGLLSQADPGALEAGRDALAASGRVHLDTGTEPRSCSFSADGRWAAVTVLSSGKKVAFARTWAGRDLSAGEDLTVDWLLFGLPDGNLVKRSRGAGILHDARLADRWENHGYEPAVAIDGRVFGLSRPAFSLYPSPAQQIIMPCPGGFVREDVILPDPGVPPPYQGGLPHDGTLTFCDAGGRELRRVGFHGELGLPDRWHYGLKAVDADSGRLLVYSGERAWLLDREARGVLASTPPDTFVEAAGFRDPEHLVMVSSAPGGHTGPYIRVWRVRNDQIVIETEMEPKDRFLPLALAVFPGRGEIATIDNSDQLRWLDAHTLTETGIPRKAVSTPLWDAPDGRTYAHPAPGGTGIEVFIDSYPARVTELADRPLAEMAPPDLAAVTGALTAPHPPAASAARSFLELLQDCLHLWFASGENPASRGGKA